MYSTSGVIVKCSPGGLASYGVLVYPVVMQQFADWLRGHLAGRTTVREFAKRVGVNHNTAQMWMKGAYRPSWQNCAAIARALGVDPRLVRQVAGYEQHDEPGPEEVALPSSEPELVALAPERGTPSVDEAELMQAYREASPEGRRILALAVEIVKEMRLTDEGELVRTYREATPSGRRVLALAVETVKEMTTMAYEPGAKGLAAEEN